jgi:hypothetical protein
MFHDVLLLGKGGKTVYLGESGRAIEYQTIVYVIGGFLLGWLVGV